jgi:hypothetical protein
MSTPKSNRLSTPPRRTFGTNDSALDDTDSTPTRSAFRRLPRISFGSLRRPSFASKGNSDSEGVISPSVERARIPSVSVPAPEVYATPLPVLSMIVLSITLLGEFLTANVCTPFLLFMVKGFGSITDEADIAFWTGILVATFFLTQFLTSLLWVSHLIAHNLKSTTSLFFRLLSRKNMDEDLSWLYLFWVALSLAHFSEHLPLFNKPYV